MVVEYTETPNRVLLTEKRIILNHGYEELIVGEKRFRPGQGGKVGGGRFLWQVVSRVPP
jgi:hypothetical protein